MSYLLTSKDQVLDLNTWQFMPKSAMKRPFELKVPIYFWKFRELETHKDFFGKDIYRMVTNLYLRDTSVQVNADNCHVIINTEDGQKDFLICPQHKHTEARYGMPFYVLQRVDYTVIHNNSHTKYTTKVSDQPLDAPAFTTEIRGLARYNIWPRYDNAWLVYGIKPTKYSIMYGKRDLKRQNYAMLCGTWAVLLTDDMMFDSLALLQGVTEDKLYIDKFIYSRNSYIVKMMVLGDRRDK